MKTLEKTEKGYNLAVTALYLAAIGLNLWVGYKILEQSEEGQEVIAQVKEATIGRVRSFKARFFHDLSSQLLIEEAEDVVRRAWSGEREE